MVDGRRLEAVEAVGKELRLSFSGGVTVASRLRMSGRWLLLGPGLAVRGSPWLVLRTDVATAVLFHGPQLSVVEGRPPLRHDLLADDVDLGALVQRLRLADPRRPLLEVVQDQSLVAGIGNMWASETLWAAQVHPRLPVGNATDDELEAALRWARDAMSVAVETRRPAHAVYRRVGRPCGRCGSPIRSTGVGDDNRTAYFCDGCQRRA
jgi:endonuclease-8